MPTTRPRYTFTDTGAMSAMLDDAARRWPQETRRKELLARLACAGHEVVSKELADSDRAARGARQRQALRGLGEHVDAELLLGDGAWR